MYLFGTMFVRAMGYFSAVNIFIFVQVNGNGEYELECIKVEEITSKQNNSNKPNGCLDGIANEDRSEAAVPLK